VVLGSSQKPGVTRSSPTRATPSVLTSLLSSQVQPIESARQFIVQTCSEDPLDKPFDFLCSPPPYAALQESECRTNNEDSPPILIQNSLTRGSRPLLSDPRNEGNQSPLQRPPSARLPHVLQHNAIAIRRGEQRRADNLHHQQTSRVPPRHCPSRASASNAPTNASRLSRSTPTSTFTHSRGAREVYRPSPASNVGVSARHGPPPFQRASSPKLRPASVADYQLKLWRS
jgi:hypothetical protein